MRRVSTPRYRKCSRSRDSHGYPCLFLGREKLLPNLPEGWASAMKESLEELTGLKTEASKIVTSLDSSWRTCGVTQPVQLAKLAPMGLEFWNEMGMPGKFVPERWIESWTNLLRQSIALIIGLTRHGTLKGAIGGVLCWDLNDHDLIAVEQFWFVTAAARGHGLRLLDEFDKTARLRGAKRVLIGHIHSGRTNLWQKILARKGYTLLESHYIK